MRIAFSLESPPDGRKGQGGQRKWQRAWGIFLKARRSTAPQFDAGSESARCRGLHRVTACEIVGSRIRVGPKAALNAMKARISLITLGVDDLEKSLRFYRDGLGLQSEGIVGTEFEYGAVAFFVLEGNLKLAIWPRQSLARDTGLPVDKRSATEFSIGHNVASKSEVDAVMQRAAEAGATIVKKAHDTFWGGYAGYFQDPDGHLWEVAWNPEAPSP